MGFAMFTARKMSLQSRVNDYNARLMELSNKENQIINRTAMMQQLGNVASSAGGLAGGLIGTFLGGPVGSVVGGGIGNYLGQQIGNNGFAQAKLNADQKKLDTEKQRLTTLLQKAQAELQQVEKAEEQAIKSGTPKYVG